MATHAAARAMVEVDGSLMEGGGQILRMSTALSALLDKPVRIFSIRGKRSKPGLKSQHLTGINLVRELTEGQLKGGALNSSEIVFDPRRRPVGGTHRADIGTAGATTLLAQVSLPCLLFGRTPCELDLRGGTNADFAPIVEYYSEVFLPSLRRFGVAEEAVEFEVLRKGYFPRGGGHVRLRVCQPPALPLAPVEMVDRGEVSKVTVRASVAGTLPVRLAEEMAESARAALTGRLPPSVEFETSCFKETSAAGNGSSVFVRAETTTGCVLGDSAVGSPKTRPRETGAAAANGLLLSLESGACADRWLQDQLVVFMALAGGRSRVRTGPLTMHAETAIDVARRFTEAKFQVLEEEDGSRIVECQGIGLKRALGSE